MQINTVSIVVGTSSNGAATSVDLQNLKLMIGGTQFGTTQGVVTEWGHLHVLRCALHGACRRYDVC